MIRGGIAIAVVLLAIGLAALMFELALQAAVPSDVSCPDGSQHWSRWDARAGVWIYRTRCFDETDAKD